MSTADEELPIEIKLRHDIETGVWPWEEAGGRVGAAERIQQVQNLLDAVDRLTAELADVYREVKEWACEKCNMVFPGPPQPGFACVQCPRCGGSTMPKTLLEKRKLTAERDRLQVELAATRQQMADKEAAGYVVVELWEKRADALREENAKLKRWFGDESKNAQEAVKEIAKLKDQLVAAIRVVERYRASGVAPSNVMQEYDAALAPADDPWMRCKEGS